MKKFIAIVGSVILIAILGFCLVWTIINFATVKDGMSGTAIYTATDLESAYNDGYNTALTDKDYYDELVGEYKTLYENGLVKIEELNKQILDLTNSTTNKDTTIESLEITINELNTTIIELNNQIEELESTINSKDSDLVKLQQEYNYFVEYQYNSLVEVIEEQGYCVVGLLCRDSNCYYGLYLVEKGQYLNVDIKCKIEEDGHYHAIGDTYYFYLDDEKINLSTYQINDSVIVEISKVTTFPFGGGGIL